MDLRDQIQKYSDVRLSVIQDSYNAVYSWSGEDIRRCMRQHHVTIRSLAMEMRVTQVKVRRYRRYGVGRLVSILDVRQGIDRAAH